MSQLRKVPIGEVLEMRRTSVDIELDETYQPVGLRAFGRGIFDYPTTKGVDLSKVRYFELPPEAVIVSNIKGWEGAVAVTDGDEKGRIASSRFLTYMPSSVVDPSFVRHWLLSDDGMGVLDRCSPGSADRNRTLSRRSFEASLLPLPPIDEQRRIAAHLDQLSHVQVSASGATRPAVSTLLNGLDWSGSMGDLVEFDPVVVDVDPGVVYRAMGVFGQGRGVIDRGSFRGGETKYTSMYSVHGGQVVFSRLKAFEGAVAVVPSSMDRAVVSKEFPLFTPRAGVDADFLSALVSSPRFVESMAGSSTGIGARRERLSAASFLNLAVPVLSPAQQAKIGAMERLVRLLDSAQVTRTTLADALLPAARNEIFSAMR